MPQFLSTIFAIIGLVALCVGYGIPALTLVGKYARKSIHDRADEGSDADCYLIAVLKGATDNPNLAGEGAVRLPVAGKHSHFIRPQIAPSERSGL